MTKRILFVVRAHNDMDCRSPLMAFLARRHEVGVLALPTERGMFGIQNYDFIDLVISAGVKIEKSDHFLGWMSRYIKGYFALTEYFSRQTKLLRFPSLKALHAIFNFAAKITLRLRSDEIDSYVNGYDLLVVDEIIFEPGRSVFFSHLTELVGDKRVRCLSMLTGQNLYKELEGAFPACWSGRRNDVPLLVPCENDKVVLAADIDAEIKVVGNTRFDRDWVNEISAFAIDEPDMCVAVAGGSKTDGPRIAVMCSKFEGYGVDEKEF